MWNHDMTFREGSWKPEKLDEHEKKQQKNTQTLVVQGKFCYSTLPTTVSKEPDEKIFLFLITCFQNPVKYKYRNTCTEKT